MADSPIQDFPVQSSAGKGSADSADSVSAPARPKRPNGAPIVLGLVALVFAALVIASETVGLRVDWVSLGPGAIVGVGALLVALGAVGLVRRRDES